MIDYFPTHYACHCCAQSIDAANTGLRIDKLTPNHFKVLKPMPLFSLFSLVC